LNYNPSSYSGFSLKMNTGKPKDGFEAGIGGFFCIRHPSPEDIPDKEKYDFKYNDIDFDRDIFQNFNYQ